MMKRSGTGTQHGVRKSSTKSAHLTGRSERSEGTGSFRKIYQAPVCHGESKTRGKEELHQARELDRSRREMRKPRARKGDTGRRVPMSEQETAPLRRHGTSFLVYRPGPQASGHCPRRFLRRKRRNRLVTMGVNPENPKIFVIWPALTFQK